MSAISKIKSLWDRFNSISNFLRSFEKVIDKHGVLTIRYNKIKITISPEGDVTMSGVRKLDLNYDFLFMDCQDEWLKAMCIENPDAVLEKFKMTPEKIVEEKMKYGKARR